MKILPAIFFACLIIFVSCRKTGMQTPATSKQSDAILSNAKQSNFTLLTAHPWKYKKLVYFYHADTDSGMVMYERGADNNLYPYNTNRVYFYKNGNYDYKNEYGNHTPGTWKFAAGTNQTVVEITYTYYNSHTFYTIKRLDQNHYNVTYPSDYTTRYAEFITALQ